MSHISPERLYYPVGRLPNSRGESSDDQENVREASKKRDRNRRALHGVPPWAGCQDSGTNCGMLVTRNSAHYRAGEGENQNAAPSSLIVQLEEQKDPPQSRWVFVSSYFSLRTPLCGARLDLTLINRPVVASRLTQVFDRGFLTWERRRTAPRRRLSPDGGFVAIYSHLLAEIFHTHA